MKRSIVICLVVGFIFGTDAFASRARNMVTGTGDAGLILGTSGGIGSFYEDDAYNMFYNPAYVNDYTNWATIEKSNFSSTNAGTTAMGGFATSMGMFNVSLYMNRLDELNAREGKRLVMEPLDVTLGTKWNNISWGLGFQWANHTYRDTAVQATGDKEKHTAQLFNLKLGAQAYNFEPFIHWQIKGKYQDTALVNYTEKKVTAGLKYHWGEWTPYLVYQSAKDEFDAYHGPTSTTTYAQDKTTWGLGLGRHHDMSNKVSMGYSVGYFAQSNKSIEPTIRSNREVVPVEFSASAKALDWMTVRAGVGYHLIDTNDTDNTTGRVGATFNWNKVSVDWVVGANTNGGTETATDADGQTFSFSDGLFTAASATYAW